MTHTVESKLKHRMREKMSISFISSFHLSLPFFILIFMICFSTIFIFKESSKKIQTREEIETKQNSS